MKKWCVVATAVGMTLATSSFAACDFAVVDLHQIQDQSPSIKKALVDLKNQFSDRIADLTKRNKQIEADYQNFQKNGPTMTAKDKASFQDKLNKEGVELHTLQMQLSRDFATAQNKAAGDQLARVQKVISDIAADKKYCLVVEKHIALYSADSLDITKDVIDKLK